MTQLAPPVVQGRWWPVARFVVRTGRRSLAESLYLLTAPLTAGVGLLLVLGGLCAGTVGLLVPRRGSGAVRALRPARWCADLEWWRIARVRPAAADEAVPGRRSRGITASDPGLWLEVAHPVVIFPVALVTSAVTALWWSAGVAAATSALRFEYLSPLSARGAQSATSLDERLAFGTMLGLALLAGLPLVTRACVAVQAGLGQLMLSEVSALHRRIGGLERERDSARAQTVAAVTAETAALRRLERDLHDGPQQRLVRLAMELGRAQHHFDSRPEAAREAIADAIALTQEAVGELRALSRGIAPPILADRGLRGALAALAARSTVPCDLDADVPDQRLAAAVETAAYFVVAEALTNVAKHSYARRCAIGLRHRGGALRVWVTDDGAGGAGQGARTAGP